MPDDFSTLVSAARLRLRGKSAFFATLLLHAEIVPSREVGLAATDGERVYLNPDAAPALPPALLDGLLLHEVLHAALSHVPRRGPREAVRWNAAADVVVNGLVAGAGLSLMPGTELDEHLSHLSVEEVYTALEGRPPGQPQPDLLSGPPSDAPLGRSGKPSEAALARQWKGALEQARSVEALSGQGRGGLGLHREFGRLGPARVDWRAQLWRFLVRTPVDFSGFDRRFIGRRLYLEALDDESLRVLVGIDTSGSIDEGSVSAFVAELRAMLGAYPHLHAKVYYADTELYGPHELTLGSDLPGPQGGGGTDFRPLLALAEDGEAELVVYLTDGYGDFPDTAPRTPLLWVVTPGGAEDQTFPFGEIVRLGED